MKNIEIEIRPSEALKVPRYIEELSSAILEGKEIGLEQALAKWAERITERRLAWFEGNKDSLKLKGTEVRRGFQLVLFEYMKLNPAEILIIEETKTKITWRAYNFCPYLQAIQALGLDTRLVCKYATEVPVQALLSALDSRLRFSRDYVNGIRPYTKYCEETIELVVDS